MLEAFRVDPLTFSLLANFPRLSTARPSWPPDRVRKLFLDNTRLVAQDPHQWISYQTCLRDAMRKQNLTATRPHLHDDPAWLALAVQQPIAQPDLRSAHSHPSHQQSHPYPNRATTGANQRQRYWIQAATV